MEPKAPPTLEAVTLSPQQLADLITAGVKAALAGQAAPALDIPSLATAIGTSVATSIEANAGPKKVTIGQYIRRGGHSPFHPKSYKETPKLSRMVSVNGRPVDENTSFDKEIDLMNAITHSGRYIDRLVEVVVSDEGSDETVDIRFNNKTDRMFELRGHLKGKGDFINILEEIVAAQAEERAQNDTNEEKRQARRTFGNTKGYRDAATRSQA